MRSTSFSFANCEQRGRSDELLNPATTEEFLLFELREYYFESVVGLEQPQVHGAAVEQHVLGVGARAGQDLPAGLDLLVAEAGGEDEALEAQEGQQLGVDVERVHESQHQHQDREDVPEVGPEDRENAEVPHDEGEAALGDAGQLEEVVAEGVRDPGEVDRGEDQTGPVRLLVGVEAVEAGQLDLEQRGVHAEADVGEEEQTHQVDGHEALAAVQGQADEVGLLRGLHEDGYFRDEDDHGQEDGGREEEEGECVFELAVPEPDQVVEAAGGLAPASGEGVGLDDPVRTVLAADDVLGEEGLEEQLPLPGERADVLPRSALHLLVVLDQRLLGQGHAPRLHRVAHQVLGHVLQHRVALLDQLSRGQSVLQVAHLLLQPVEQLLLLLLQLGQSELQGLQLYLQGARPPARLGGLGDAVREQHHHEQEAETVGRGHGIPQQVLVVELVPDQEVDCANHPHRQQHDVEDEVVEDGPLDLESGGELTGLLVLLEDGQQEEGQQEVGPVEAAPHAGQGAGLSPQRVVDVEGQDEHDRERAQPGEEDDGARGVGHVARAVAVEQDQDEQDEQNGLADCSSNHWIMKRDREQQREDEELEEQLAALPGLLLQGQLRLARLEEELCAVKTQLAFAQASFFNLLRQKGQSKQSILNGYEAARRLRAQLFQLQGRKVDLARELLERTEHPLKELNRQLEHAGEAGKHTGKEGKRKKGEQPQRYCYCGGISSGEMICCENVFCEREWFHLECTGLKTVPRGKWFCGVCRKVKK